MRNLKQKIKLDKKCIPIGQNGEEYLDYIKDFESYDLNPFIETKLESYSSSIGKFLIIFSKLENQMNLTLSFFIDESSTHFGFCIINRIRDFSERLNLLNDLWSDQIKLVNNLKKKNKLFEEKEIVRKKLIEISEFRNKIAHANWTSLDKERHVSYSLESDKHNLGLSFKKVKLTSSVINKFVRQMESIYNILENFPEKLWEAQRLEYKN